MKRSKWLAPLIATTIALSSVASVVPQQAVEAKTTTKKTVYLPIWQGIKVDDLEFFPRKGYIRYSKENGLEYYMRVYSSLGVYTTGFRPLNMKKKKATMLSKMFKSLHTNQFRIQTRTVIGQDKKKIFFYMMIGEKGMLPNHVDAEIYDFMVNDYDQWRNEYVLRCNFAGLYHEHDAITRYLAMGRLDYAEEIWKGYEKVYTPDYKAQQEESLNRMLNVLADMEGFNKEQRVKFKEILTQHAELGLFGPKSFYEANFMFNGHKYMVEGSPRALQFDVTKL